ncbi:uncharacterized protein F5Z01DRAFT_723527 [Emericellopsis atlantica]|uniref:Uncharacterized protein n=1 Tax=Emericellopsis atlantica TaxID=2614577 RepID=A0A9P7ZLJ9_9HYPO|nr:uncharacterized protein F5Z01DRAFT_723527 [Emericellopsis atlantica]KAG9254348.1 hypothetical protein F5Z01DRAFT_723527 [Emericellopsis atlantica]
MAEVAGLVLGIVPLLVQTITYIDRYKDIRNSALEAPAEVSSLLAELDLISYIVGRAKEGLPQANACDEFLLRHCTDSLSQLMKDLGVLNAKLQDRGQSKFRNPVKVLTFRHWRPEAQKLRESIQLAKIDLFLRPSSGEQRLLAKFVESSTRIIEQDEVEVEGNDTDHTANAEPEPTAPSSPPSRQNPRGAPRASQRIRTRKPDRCAANSCPCACHRMVATSRRFWALEYSPLAVFFQNCDTDTCSTTRYGINFRIALSQLGIERALVVDCFILSTFRGFSLRSAFTVEHVVPYTSLGFETIWKVQTRQISFREARETLTGMFRAGPGEFRQHVNPSGVSYIEELVVALFRRVPLENIHALLRLFVIDFEMTRGVEHPRFLIKCAQLIGEGPHLGLLESLLSLGIDLPEVAGNDWPAPCSPNWISESLTPDPFFIEYLDLLRKNNQGKELSFHRTSFAGMTPLHEAILDRDTAAFERWLNRAKPDQQNSLGQTPIHIAVSAPQFLNALIERGHDVNSVDRHGITPLMYAAATNQLDALAILIRSDADLFTECNLNQRTFLHYAMARENWRLVLSSLKQIELAAGQDVAEELSQTTTMQFLFDRSIMANPSVDYNVELFDQLLTQCVSVNFLFNDLHEGVCNNSLMHAVSSSQQVEALLRHGFERINHRNNMGQSPLIRAVQKYNPGLVRSVLAARAHVDLEDNWKRTSLYYSLVGLKHHCINKISNNMAIVRILLSHGANAVYPDNCRCPCSPGGCFPTSALAHEPLTPGSSQDRRVPVWSLELLHVLHEVLGPKEARLVLLSFIRRLIFDHLGMTHVCCQREVFFPSPWHPNLRPDTIPTGKINEIIDKESDLTDTLEDSMKQLVERSFDELLVTWMGLTKKSLDIEISKTDDYKRGLPRRSREVSIVFREQAVQVLICQAPMPLCSGPEERRVY